MPYNDPDPTDPSILVGISLQTDADATMDMAYVFAEEFARMGYDADRLMGLFRNPFYGGAHDAYQRLGDEAVRGIVEECVGAWGSLRVVAQDSSPPDEEEEAMLIQIEEMELNS
jgi:hypothetical protein